ncbi:uncharacterized protein c-cup isoform X1 [Drosophila virilis]|uniref:uncharacterized protein c-cup isoform X1 n=1 Tax=Drosophila virilis TaxID=7244 RepID=UPI00017D4206|nr:membrane steroid-binding protein 1 isoform X1 [Drosophila virilis]XP_032293977.1 membrane steroid-binding protein 1 isoform X1 [Drosophila virilis]XP_032293979.1 membrane steroid-binding protein 1 isoform X1 [Drosophila virilis]XP_032293980.1 membrane steroid-binding protein 1 isoform X1 [Drosophila virilis]
MSLLKLFQIQLPFAKENLNIYAAVRLIRPLLRSPIAQVVISFAVGYYATTKLAQIYALFARQADKSPTKVDYPSQLATDCRDSQANLRDRLPPKCEALRLTRRQLTAYDGMQDSQPIYTALNGNIYDLSSSRDTFLGPGPYSLLAGCNANHVLNIACGSMGVCTDDVLQRWERSLNAEFHIVGYLTDSEGSESDDYESDVSTLVSKRSQEHQDSNHESNYC